MNEKLSHVAALSKAEIRNGGAVMKLAKMIKRLKIIDLGLIKWSVLMLTIWALIQFPFIYHWLQQYNPWWFLALSIVLAIRPCLQLFIGKE